MQSQVPFPYLPLVMHFSKGNMMVKDLQNLVFFFVSSVDTAASAAKGLRRKSSSASSKQSGRQTGIVHVRPAPAVYHGGIPGTRDPAGRPRAGKIHEPVCRQARTRWIPRRISSPAGSIPSPAGPETRIVLVGDGDFARDQYLGGSRDNLTFFANMVDYLVDDAGLITIRSKDVTLPPLEQVSDGTKKLVKYANLALPPLLVLGYGAIRWRMRKARKKAMEMQ